MCGNSEVEQSLKQYKILSIIQAKLEQNRRNLAFEFFNGFLFVIFLITIVILFLLGLHEFFGSSKVNDSIFLIISYFIFIFLLTPIYLVWTQFWNFYLTSRMINSKFINDCIVETYGLNDIDKSDVLDVFSRMLQNTKTKSFKKISYTKAIDFIEKEKEKYAVTNIIEMIEQR